MEFTEQEKTTQEQAKKYIIDKKDDLIKKFILDKKPLRIGMMSLFMAGSPGAGKTEFANNYIRSQIDKNDKDLQKILQKRSININEVDNLFIKIDVDEIRSFIPQYKKTDKNNGQKGNAEIIQTAANKGLDILRDYCLNNDISFLHDGTFGNYKTMRGLVKDSLSKGRMVQINYIYLDPLVAWEFTKAREFLEGRNINKDKFIPQFFDSQKNVDEIKKEFGDNVKVHCILKYSKDGMNLVLEKLDIAKFSYDISFNEPSIAMFLEIKYNANVIKRYTKGDLSDLLR